MRNRKFRIRSLLHLLFGFALFATVAWPFWQQGFSLSPPSIPNQASTGTPYGPIQFQLMNPQGQPVSGATFFIINGPLPPGLTLTPAGVLSGTPTEGGFYFFGIGGEAPGEVYAEQYYDIFVEDNPIITNTSLPSGQVGTSYFAQLTGALGSPPYFFYIDTEVEVLPPGLELSENGVISGVPTATGVYPIPFRIWDEGDGTSTKTLTIVINSPPPPVQVTTQFLPDAYIGSPYNVQLTSSPSGPGFTWAILSGGSLPPGLTLDANTGIISGTPTQLGIYPFAVTVTASSSYDGVTSPPALLRIVVAPPQLTLFPETLSNGMVGVPYEEVFQPLGGTGSYVLSLASGTLPTGLTLNSSTRTLSGIPTEAGRFGFQIRVTSDQIAFDRLYSVLISPRQLTFGPETLPGGYTGLPYSAQLSGINGIEPYAFAVIGGQLPPGITLDSSGALSGTPATAGLYSIIIRVADSSSLTATRSLSILIADQMTISPSQLPDGTTGEPYIGELIVSGGVAPVIFTLGGGALPVGMQLRPGGTVAGTPTVIGSYRFTARATDSNGQTVDTEVGLNVIGAVGINPEQLPPGTHSVPYSQTITVTGGTEPYSYSLSGNLPPGITFGGTTFSGTPTAFGDFPVALTVSDSSGKSATRNYVLSVLRTVIITTQSLPGGTAGTAYSATVQAAGGRPPYEWSTLGTLPAGLAIDASTGVISGTPTQSGNFTFTVGAADREGVDGMRVFSLAIAVPPPPQVTITQLPPTSAPGQQPGFSVQTSDPYPLPLDGMVALTFAPDSGPDDPAVQFASGGRTTSYTIPANATAAEFSGIPAVQTGTVAGLITLTTRYSAGGADVTPTPPPTQTLRVEAASPTITSVQLTRTQSGFDVTILGFSSTRQVNSALIRFTAASGANLQTQQVTVQLESVFQQWFASPQSAEFGGQFRLTIPFTIAGDQAGIASVSAQLTNSQGAGNTVTANF